MTTTSATTATRHISRDEEIVQEYATRLGLTFPSYADYRTFTPVQKYIATLGEQVRSAEVLVTTAVKHVTDNAANALTRGNSQGALQASGPLLDVQVATLVDRRQTLALALEMLLSSDAEEFAAADRKIYGGP